MLKTEKYPGYQKELEKVAGYYEPYKRRPQQLAKFMEAAFEKKQKLAEFFKLDKDTFRMRVNVHFDIKQFLDSQTDYRMLRANAIFSEQIDSMTPEALKLAFCDNKFKDESGREVVFTRWMSRKMQAGDTYQTLLSRLRERAQVVQKQSIFFVSANPLDIQTMSANTTFTSCMAPNSDHYPSGPFAYNTDTMTMIMFSTENGEPLGRKNNRVMLYLTPCEKQIVVGQPYHNGSGWSRNDVMNLFGNFLKHIEVMKDKQIRVGGAENFTRFSGAAARANGSGNSIYFDNAISGTVGSSGQVLKFNDGLTCPNCEQQHLQRGRQGACNDCYRRNYFTHTCCKCRTSCYGVQTPTAKEFACEDCFRKHYERDCTHCKNKFTPKADQAIEKACGECFEKLYELSLTGWALKENCQTVYRINGASLRIRKDMLPHHPNFFTTKELAHAANQERHAKLEHTLQQFKNSINNRYENVSSRLGAYEAPAVSDDFVIAVLSDLENQVLVRA